MEQLSPPPIFVHLSALSAPPAMIARAACLGLVLLALAAPASASPPPEGPWAAAEGPASQPPAPAGAPSASPPALRGGRPPQENGTFWLSSVDAGVPALGNVRCDGTAVPGAAFSPGSQAFFECSPRNNYALLASINLDRTGVFAAPNNAPAMNLYITYGCVCRGEKGGGGGSTGRVNCSEVGEWGEASCLPATHRGWSPGD